MRTIHGVGNFLDQEFQGLVQVFPVRGAQGSFMFQLAQTLVDLNIAEGIATVHHRLMVIGTGFPRATHFAVPIPEVFKQTLGLLLADWNSDSFLEILLAQQQRQTITIKIQFCKNIALFSGKTSFADGSDTADAMVGMMNGIAFTNVNKLFPFELSIYIE